MKNFKINTNREPLTADELNAGQDFNRLLKTYKAVKPPLFKTVKFWGASALVAGIAALVLVIALKNNTSGIANAPFINPAIAGVDVPTEKYLVTAGADSTVTYKTGSRIHIPANAFLDENGNVVKGEVELSYREFHDAADILVAGIPMTYDSAGQQYHFETAGMMQIGATQNGKNLKVNPQAMINVEIASRNADDRFNTYYLDTTARQWKYIDRANYVASSQTPVGDSISNGVPAPPPPAKPKEQQAVEQVQREVLAIEKQKPVAPARADKKKPRFSIKVEEKEFPELAPYANLKFQPVDEGTYSADKAKITWEDVQLKRVAGTNNYEIIFSNASETYKVLATPAIDEKDYAAAKTIFDEKYKEYETRLATKKAEEARLKAELEERAKEIEARMQKEMEEAQRRQQEYLARMGQQTMVYRTFQVADFGFWNCDCPANLPQGADVIAHIQDVKTGKSLNISTCYLVEKGRNAVFTYYGGSDKIKNFRFNPAKENLVWAVTTDGHIAVLKADAFRMIGEKSGDVNLKMETVEHKFSSANDVRAYLEI